MEKKELTQAEILCKIAQWVANQGKEFSDHFPDCRSIFDIWNALPSDFNKARGKVTTYVMKNKKNYKGIGLAKKVNVAFKCRYFDFVPKEYYLKFLLNQYSSGGYEVRLSAFNNWTERHESTSSITIKDLGNVRNACDKLLKSHIECRGDGYDLAYSDRIKEALKNKPTKEEEMNVGYLVEI